MSDVECPYCGKDQEICHDDGYGYEEDKTHQQWCSDCRKTFTYTTSVHFYYDAEKAPCLNGEDHKMKRVNLHYKDNYPNWVRCEWCEKEDRGEYIGSRQRTLSSDNLKG